MDIRAKLAINPRNIPWVRAVANLVHGLSSKHVLTLQALYRGHRAFLVVDRDSRDWAPVLHTHLIREGAPNLAVPTVNVSERELTSELELSPAALQDFREDGILFVAERREGLGAGARQWLAILRREGAAVMTVDDAKAIIVALEIAEADRLFYLPAGWQSPEMRMVEALRITKVFAIANDVIQHNRPALVIVTPGLPNPLRVWKVGLDDALGHEIRLPPA